MSIFLFYLKYHFFTIGKSGLPQLIALALVIDVKIIELKIFSSFFIIFLPSSFIFSFFHH
uniref:hypothetical protein n=1 Tax=Spiroplasma ixodetis TaxID=2141 RepID=UPI003EB9CC13